MRVALIFILLPVYLISQYEIQGKIVSKDTIDFNLCKVGLKGTSMVITPDTNGNFYFKNLKANKYEIQCFCSNFEANSIKINAELNQNQKIIIELQKISKDLEEIAVIGTIKETNRLESPIITDVYDKKFFVKNPTPNLLDMVDRMNGVRPQVNCNVCGTGDIHLNGLEGPYTLVILDGVPIVGGLSSVYGLSGIPSFLLDRIEVTKGPASSIYGSEAVAGVIHAFTKKTSKKPEFQFQHFTTSHLESNSDLGVNFPVGKKLAVLTTANYFHNSLKLDQNKDNFTDIPLQNRFSIFQKLNFERSEKRIFTISGRYMTEKRWGGELNWDRTFRGSDSIYAESIDLKRGEVNLVYQLPLKEKLLFLSHVNFHQQDSYYGKTEFDAFQRLAFFQLTWDKTYQNNQFFSGITYRDTYYDDNTVLTQSLDSLKKNQALISRLPGIFWQHDIKIKSKTNVLYSCRLDYHKEHGYIFTPRIAIMYRIKDNLRFRLHAGSGFRVVNLFSEDHAALTGARQVVIKENLNPERSKSINSSISHTRTLKNEWNFELDWQIFYTYFSNRIVPDYLTNANLIIYSNSKGYAQSLGSGIDIKFSKLNHFSFQTGITIMNVNSVENGITSQQLLTEKISGNWTISYSFQKIPLTIDYTGNLVGPMKLPILNAFDPRPEYSRPYSIQNIQFTYKIKDQFVLFGGVKNILNWTPAKNIPFLIARSNDPFDKKVTTDSQGNILQTSENPYALTFDPAYVYAPNQGIRMFLGFRVSFTKK